MGLVRQVSASLAKRNIQRLTQTYLTLSLGHIAEQVGLPSAQEAELYVLRCVADGGSAVLFFTLLRGHLTPPCGIITASVPNASDPSNLFLPPHQNDRVW